MTKPNQAIIGGLGRGQSEQHEPVLLPIHYATALQQIVKQMIKDGIEAELEPHYIIGKPAIRLVLKGVMFDGDGEIVEA